jgi:hypothetical protein
MMEIAERKSSFIMLGLLVVLTFVYHTGQAVYILMHVDPLPTFEFLHLVALSCGTVWWLRAEAKRSGAKALYCEGLLVTVGWIIILPYHLIKTRGVKGLIPLFALIGSLIVSQVVAAVIYVIFFAQV